jgi:acyl carrier protein phosphodiesterase
LDRTVSHLPSEGCKDSQKNTNLRLGFLSDDFVAQAHFCMNFLAHFYLDRMHESSQFVVGAATPDLMSIYNSGFRIKASRVDHLPAETRAMVDPQFLLGLERHFHADRVFHSSPLFAQETHALSRMMEERFAEQELPRKYFIAHILLELLLDKVLIYHDADLLGDYYAHFARLAPYETLRQGTEIVSAHQMPNYEAFIGKFVDNKYLYHYTENDHLIYILRRLLRRVGIEQSHFLDDPRFDALMHDFEDRIEGYFEQFFSEIRGEVASE